MRNIFKGLSLYRDFPVELSDFMPASDAYDDESKAPPLGNTPMPMKMSSNTLQKNPQTNLTRNEEALLSPTEKVIAGRT